MALNQTAVCPKGDNLTEVIGACTLCLVTLLLVSDVSSVLQHTLDIHISYRLSFFVVFKCVLATFGKL